MNKYIAYTLFLILVTHGAYAVDVKGKVSTGYDSNPYRLSDDLDDDSGWFLNTEISALQKIGKFEVSGSVKNRSYEGSINSANETLSKIKGRYKTQYKTFGAKTYSQIGLEAGIRDKTYVSRPTGMIGTFGGEKIGNRYDYDFWNVFTKSSFYLSPMVKTDIGLVYTEKDYEDFSLPGLSNLDYEQLTFSNAWSLKPNETNEVKASFAISERAFDDKRQKNIGGASIGGTNLKQYYHSAKLGYNHDFNKNLSTNVAVRYEERTDNGPGYYDTENLKYYASVDYQANDDLLMYISSYYQDYEYVNAGTTIDDGDDDLPGKQGYSVTVGLEQSLEKICNIPALAFFKIQFDEFRSDDDDYEYNRYQAMVGVEVSID